MENLKILITGDFCPISRIEKLAIERKFNLIFNEFYQVFEGNELNITDIECPLTASKEARLKYGPHQKAHPNTIGILRFANISLGTMANNHIADYGSKGIIDTLELCTRNDIHTIGIGRNQTEASEPFSKIINGKKLSIFNYAENEFISTSDGLFIGNSMNPVKMYKDLNSVKSFSDYRIVIIHGGNEHYHLPSPRIKALYRYLVDVGADAVFSHHTHVYSGYEVYHGKPIFYGLGNFLYDRPDNVDEAWNRGYAVRLSLSDSINFEIIPFKQGGKLPGLFHLSSKEEQEFHSKIDFLNRIIEDDTKLESEFVKYCRVVYPMYESFIEPGFGKYISSLRKRGLFPKLLSRRKKLLLLNIMRCESHRDVMIRMLSESE